MILIFILLFTCQIVFFFFILVIFLALFDLGYPPVSWKSADLQDWEQSRTGVQ